MQSANDVVAEVRNLSKIHRKTGAGVEVAALNNVSLSIHRNQFTGPGEFMSDMSIFKNFTITERVKAQFQAEFFNVFNHPVYALPGNTCIDCSGAGVITGLEFDSQMRQMQLGFRVTF